MNLYNRYFYSFISQTIVFLSNFIAIPIIITNSNEDNYGQYVLLIAYLSILTAIAPLGLGFKAKRFMPSYTNIRDRTVIFFPQFYAHFALTLIFSFVFIFVLTLFDDLIFGSNFKISNWVIILYSIIFALYAQLTIIFKYSQNIIKFNILVTFVPLIFLFLIAFSSAIQIFLSVELIIIFHIISLLISILFFLLPAIKIVGFSFSIYKKSDLLWDFRYGLPVLATAILEIIINISDRFIIAAFMKPADVAYYSVAFTICSLLLIFPRLFSHSLEPRLMYLKDKMDLNSIKELVEDSIFLFYFFGIPITLGSYLYGNKAISIVLGESFSSNVGFVLPLLMVGCLFYGLAIIISMIYFAFIKTKALMIFNTTAAVSNLFINILVFSFFESIYVAAISSIISYFILLALLSINLKKIITIKIINNELVKNLIAAIFTSFICVKIFDPAILYIDNDLFEILVSIIIFIIIYCFFNLLFKSKVISLIKNAYN